jgi:hypothetical protein
VLQRKIREKWRSSWVLFSDGFLYLNVIRSIAQICSYLFVRLVFANLPTRQARLAQEIIPVIDRRGLLQNISFFINRNGDFEFALLFISNLL